MEQVRCVTKYMESVRTTQIPAVKRYGDVTTGNPPSPDPSSPPTMQNDFRDNRPELYLRFKEGIEKEEKEKEEREKEEKETASTSSESGTAPKISAAKNLINVVDPSRGILPNPNTAKEVFHGSVCTYCNPGSHNRLLLHCTQGISRSSSCILAYLMEYEGMSLKEAYEYVKNRRSVIDPRADFVDALRELEIVLYNERRFFGGRRCCVNEAGSSGVTNSSSLTKNQNLTHSDRTSSARSTGSGPTSPDHDEVEKRSESLLNSVNQVEIEKAKLEGLLQNTATAPLPASERLFQLLHTPVPNLPTLSIEDVHRGKTYLNVDPRSFNEREFVKKQKEDYVAPEDEAKQGLGVRGIIFILRFTRCVKWWWGGRLPEVHA